MAKTKASAMTCLLLTMAAVSLAGTPTSAETTPQEDGIGLSIGTGGVWVLDVGDLACDVTSQSGVLPPGVDSISFSVTCVDETACLYVSAETETNQRAEATAQAWCGDHDMDSADLAADCHSETTGNQYDYCFDDDSGDAGTPVHCFLDATAVWWDAGSTARAACVVPETGDQS